MEKLNREELVKIASILLKTPRSSVAIVVDRSEHESLYKEISLKVACLYNKNNNTLKFDGSINLLHNENSTTHGKRFNHCFYYSGNPEFNKIKADYSYIVN